MARTQYTFTFTNAQPGADVGFNFPAYADGSTPDADGPAVVLDSTNSVSVWADSDYLIAHTVDGRGVQIVGVATHAYPTQTIDAGVAGSSPFGTGGSSPVTRQWFNSRTSQEVVNNNSFHQLTWTPGAAPGDDLLDLTDPLNPVPHVAGIYAVTINVVIDPVAAALPVSGQFVGFIELDMDLNGFDGTGSTVFPINCDNTGTASPQGTVSVTCYLPADGVIGAYVKHNCGQAQSAFLEAVVQRIS